jgi:Peptidase family M48
MRFTKWTCTILMLLSLGAWANGQAQSDSPKPDAGQAQPAAQSAVQAAAGTSQPQTAATPAAAPAPAPPPASVAVASSSSQTSAAAPPATIDQVIDRFIAREKALVDLLKDRTPVVETYLQTVKADADLGLVPTGDKYFLGHMDLGEDIEHRTYLKDSASIQKHLLGGVNKLFTVQYKPLGFSWMIFADRDEFDRDHYEFKFVRREFLGDVRTLVFDVTPKKEAGNGRFLGRVWVEDQEYNVVRLNGTYAPHQRNEYFFHMDSWRLNLIPGYWVPSYIYSEEGDFRYGQKNKFAFRAQTRMWGYDLKKAGKEDELTQILVDSPSVQDQSAAAQDASPVESQRLWQQQAEDNALDRLQKAGLLAPEGEVDKVLQTVVNNMMITNNIDLPRPVRCRVLLTSPLETFSVGNTIVLSRGLVDVLPDEASLAMVLSHELAHIALGQNVGSKYAYNDRMLFDDETTYSNLGFRHDDVEEQSADKKALELLKNSPYAQKLDSAGLFLRMLSARGESLPGLLTAHLGNPIAVNGVPTRLTDIMNSAPALDMTKLDQIAALPLGGRVKLNPWDNKVELTKSAPVALTSIREKMPFEVTPFFPRLSRLNAAASADASSAAAPTAVATAATPAAVAPAAAGTTSAPVAPTTTTTGTTSNQ